MTTANPTSTKGDSQTNIDLSFADGLVLCTDEYKISEQLLQHLKNEQAFYVLGLNDSLMNDGETTERGYIDINQIDSNMSTQIGVIGKTHALQKEQGNDIGLGVCGLYNNQDDELGMVMPSDALISLSVDEMKYLKTKMRSFLNDVMNVNSLDELLARQARIEAVSDFNYRDMRVSADFALPFNVVSNPDCNDRYGIIDFRWFGLGAIRYDFNFASKLEVRLAIEARDFVGKSYIDIFLPLKELGFMFDTPIIH